MAGGDLHQPSPIIPHQKSTLAPDPAVISSEMRAQSRWTPCIGREPCTPPRRQSSGKGSETSTLPIRKHPSLLVPRWTATIASREGPQSPAHPSHNLPRASSRGREESPPRQKLPPVNHWPGPFWSDSSSTSSSSSSLSNCLDSEIKSRKLVKNQSPSSANHHHKEERKCLEDKRNKEEEEIQEVKKRKTEEEARSTPSSSPSSKSCISVGETYLPRPWLETVPGPPAPSSSWWILSESSSSPSTSSSLTPGTFRGAGREGRRPLNGNTQAGDNDTLCEAVQSATAATISCATGVIEGEGRLYGGGHGPADF